MSLECHFPISKTGSKSIVNKNVGPPYCQAECTLAASHAAVPRWVTASIPTGQTDGQMDGRQTVTLRFPLNAACVIIRDVTQWNVALFVIKVCQADRLFIHYTGLGNQYSVDDNGPV